MIGSQTRFLHIGIDMSTQLNQKIITAHKNKYEWQLVDLYTQAADSSEDFDTQCFFLTCAHIFALEQNHPSQSILRERLKGNGRE